MATDDKARQRSFFARAQRLAIEARQAEQMKQGQAQKRNAARMTKARRQAQQRPDGQQQPGRAGRKQGRASAKLDAARTVEIKQAAEKRRDHARTQFREAARTKEQANAARATREAGMRRTAQQRKHEAMRAFNRERDARQAQDQARRTAAQQADRQRQQRQAADIRKRADAFIAARQKQQAGEQQQEHRRQTDRMRIRHREETRSHLSNTTAGIGRHAQQIRNIDNAERRDLERLGHQSRSLTGRIQGIMQPGIHTRQEKAITLRHESERMKAHQQHEQLKERQFAVAQTARLRQAQERKAIFDYHRTERKQLTMAQTKDRPRLIEQNRQAFQRAAENIRQQERSQTNTQANSQARTTAQPPGRQDYGRSR